MLTREIDTPAFAHRVSMKDPCVAPIEIFHNKLLQVLFKPRATYVTLAEREGPWNIVKNRISKPGFLRNSVK